MMGGVTATIDAAKNRILQKRSRSGCPPSAE